MESAKKAELLKQVAQLHDNDDFVSIIELLGPQVAS